MKTFVMTIGIAGTMLLGVLGTAYAVDGVIEINQARAMKGGITSGDAAGFPVTISESGSYRLSGNLTVPDLNTTAIQVSADQVTIDLNGLAILGPNSCTGCPVTSCTGSGSGVGISVASNKKNVTIRGGVVRGMGSSGILLPSGASGTAEGVQLSHNGAGGLDGFNGSVNVTGSRAENNRNVGFSSGTGVISGSLSACNGQQGISLYYGEASGNYVAGNGYEGISGYSASVFTNSVLTSGNTNNTCGIHINAGQVNYNHLDYNYCGIKVDDMGTVIGNSITMYSGQLLNLAGSIGFASNVVKYVTFSSPCRVPIVGGVEMGTNVCNGATNISGCRLCPPG